MTYREDLSLRLVLVPSEREKGVLCTTVAQSTEARRTQVALFQGTDQDRTQDEVPRPASVLLETLRSISVEK